jgi:hypothetical protein
MVYFYITQDKETVTPYRKYRDQGQEKGVRKSSVSGSGSSIFGSIPIPDPDPCFDDQKLKKKCS